MKILLLRHQHLQELKTSDNETSQSNENYDNKEEKKEHEVIHKKDGRLHIYVRQDKYKGELKSKNWVGRLYKDGKQKIYSSGTPNFVNHWNKASITAFHILDFKCAISIPPEYWSA